MHHLQLNQTNWYDLQVEKEAKDRKKDKLIEFYFGKN